MNSIHIFSILFKTAVWHVTVFELVSLLLITVLLQIEELCLKLNFLVFLNFHFNWERTQRNEKSLCGHWIYVPRMFQPSWIVSVVPPSLLDHLSLNSSGKYIHINNGQSQSCPLHSNVLFSQYLVFLGHLLLICHHFGHAGELLEENHLVWGLFPRPYSLWPVLVLRVSCWLLWLTTTM